jgi:cation transport regulator ChaB
MKLALPTAGSPPIMPLKKDDLPSTLQRSPQKVQDAYTETLESAEEQYEGNEERAHRTAWASVKHIAEKKGDHWELKDEKGPSDPQAARGGKAARDNPRETAGGVNANKTKAELEDDAREADIPGRSKMNKDELVDALKRHNDRATAKARGE